MDEVDAGGGDPEFTGGSGGGGDESFDFELVGMEEQADEGLLVIGISADVGEDEQAGWGSLDFGLGSGGSGEQEDGEERGREVSGEVQGHGERVIEGGVKSTQESAGGVGSGTFYIFQVVQGEGAVAMVGLFGALNV